MSGPAKLPPHLKIIRGTLSAKDHPAETTPVLPSLDAVPSPPEWLRNADARAEWARLAPLLVANRLLNEGNIGLLAQLCATHGHLVGIWRSRSKAKVNAAMIATYRSLSNSLGLLGWTVPMPQAVNKFAINAHRAKLPTGAR